MNICYSINEEDFNMTSVGDVLDTLDDEGRLEEGAVYWEADFCRLTGKDVISVQNLLEDMDTRLYDECGECAENGLGASKEAVTELEAFLVMWVEKHTDVARYFKIVGKPREKRVTADDLPPNAELTGAAPTKGETKP